MSIIAWTTAAFGALVVGVAVSSILDELLNRAVHLPRHRWSRAAIPRSLITVVVATVTMMVWVWLWMAYVAG